MNFRWIRYAIYNVPFMWYYLGTCDKNDVRNISFSCGLYLSQKYKKYPMWDNVIEPAVIRQFAVLDCASHSFIKGMISDNEKNEKLELALEELKKIDKEDSFANKE